MSDQSEKGWMVELPQSAIFNPNAGGIGPLFRMGQFHQRLNKAVKTTSANVWYYTGSHNSYYEFIIIGFHRELNATLWVRYDATLMLQVFGFKKLGATEETVVQLAKALAWEHYKGEIKAEDMEAYYQRKRKAETIEA